MRVILWICGAAFLFLSPLSALSEPVSDAASFMAFELGEVEAQRQEKGRPYLGFLNTAAIRAGLYVLSAGAKDRQEAHGADEVYVVMKGRSNIRIGKGISPVRPGSIIFVRAGVPHKFIDIEEQIEVLVLFSNARTNTEDANWAVSTLEQARQKANADSNIWNRFFDYKTLNMGLYMLPKSKGGDSALTHKVEEINIITKGEAIFQVGDAEMTVRPGSIVWVNEGNQHFFHTLSDDFDVLIMFHQKPGVKTP